MKARHVLRLFLMDELNDNHSKKLQIDDQKMLDELIKQNSVYLEHYKPHDIHGGGNRQIAVNIDDIKEFS